MQAAVPRRTWDIDGIGFRCVVFLSGCSLGLLADRARDFGQLAFRVGAGDALLGIAVLAVLTGDVVSGFAYLPVSGAIGKQRGLLRFNRVRATFAALLHLHAWRSPAVDAEEHYGSFRLLDVLADSLRR